MNPNLKNINHFVVLMLENRSFDHLLGGLKSSNPEIEGLAGTESCPDPNGAQGASVKVAPATAFAMSFDPGHEFEDVQMQLYGVNPNKPGTPDSTVDPARMNGFVASAFTAANAAGVPDDRKRVMEYFAPSSLSVLTALAQEFAVFNFWYSSLPGPTWPNRFFAHAATFGRADRLACNRGDSGRLLVREQYDLRQAQNRREGLADLPRRPAPIHWH